MGIAILSGVLSSLEDRRTQLPGFKRPPQSTSGTNTPVPSYMLGVSEESLPSRFLACVSRRESLKKLQRLFLQDFGEQGESIEFCAGENLRAVKESDVVILWCAILLRVYHAPPPSGCLAYRTRYIL